MWDVEYTDEFERWWSTLNQPEQAAVENVVEDLMSNGPALGRPQVDSIKESRHANMKELRPHGGNLRVLFAFDPRRTAILLIGGDKTNRWRSWYARSIAIADQLYDDHLDELRREGALQ